ncbi:hypothetical protein GvMRE_I1g289 [endosymbiont GvMRE of Glomus versiforme]|nr:hypothetical protein GvMRE_I1g289 [endosymbiont GvMRE of Glomus versiforme]
MEWINNMNCCHIAFMALIVNMVSLAIYASYNVRLDKKEMNLEKRTKELEKKNGKEQHEIDKLNQKIEKLEKLNNLLVEKVLGKSKIKK